MQTSIDKLKRIRADALYGKKRHFNSADRKERLHYWIGTPLIIINVITGSVLFYVLTHGITTWVRFIPLVLAFTAAILSGLQTYLNLQKKVEGHRRIGNKYLALFKKCDRLQGYITDNAIDQEKFIQKLEEVATSMDEVNKDAESFPTSKKDYQLAKKGIAAGEEDYTDKDLNL